MTRLNFIENSAVQNLSVIQVCFLPSLKSFTKIKGDNSCPCIFIHRVNVLLMLRKKSHLPPTHSLQELEVEQHFCEVSQSVSLEHELWQSPPLLLVTTGQLPGCSERRKHVTEYYYYRVWDKTFITLSPYLTMSHLKASAAALSLWWLPHFTRGV